MILGGLNPAKPIPPDLEAHMIKPLGFLTMDHLGRRKSSAAVPPLPTAPSRITDHVLAFIDHGFWVCTYTINESDPGRVKRHFFLPRDWLNLDWLELAIMRADGTLLCPRNGEVAVVENGVREEWLE